MLSLGQRQKARRAELITTNEQQLQVRKRNKYYSFRLDLAVLSFHDWSKGVDSELYVERFEITREASTGVEQSNSYYLHPLVHISKTLKYKDPSLQGQCQSRYKSSNGLSLILPTIVMYPREAYSHSPHSTTRTFPKKSVALAALKHASLWAAGRSKTCIKKKHRKPSKLRVFRNLPTEIRLRI